MGVVNTDYFVLSLRNITPGSVDCSILPIVDIPRHIKKGNCLKSGVDWGGIEAIAS